MNFLFATVAMVTYHVAMIIIAGNQTTIIKRISL